jgi:TPR repeat protein
MNPMRFCFFVLSLLLSVPFLCSSPANAGRLEQGTAALISGNVQDALIYLQPLASKGDVHAQVAIGVMHEKNSANFDEAAKWYRKAADQGDPVGAWMLGKLYDNGKFCGHAPYTLGGALKADPVEALKWFHKAADGGVPGAQSALAEMYKDGYGDQKQDKAEADFWYSLVIASTLYSDLSNYGIAPGSVDVSHLKELAKITRTDVEAALAPAQLADVQKRVKEWKPAASTAPR